MPSASEYTPRNPVFTTVDTCAPVAEHECNTDLVMRRSQGMGHKEGGWPENVDSTEPEQVDRYLKKVAKEHKFKASVQQLASIAEQSVKQNNTLDIYEQYFDGADTLKLTSEPPSMKAVGVFRDPSPVKRTVTAVNWHPEGTHIAVAYSVLKFQDDSAAAGGRVPASSYVWDLANSNVPVAELAPPSPLVSLRYNVKTPDILVGGSYNGMVHVFDIKKPRSVAISSSAIDRCVPGLRARGAPPPPPSRQPSPAPPPYPFPPRSHFDPVYDVFWIQSKTNNQFVSVSTDGRMLWWDTRKLSEPTDELQLTDTAGRLLGGSSAEYNIEAGPAKYLVGTEQGVVLSMNMRKAKAAAAGGKEGEKKGAVDNSGVISVMDTGSGKHHGPIYSIQRNPFHPINYLTVGDWSVRLWSEKNKTPIMVRGAPPRPSTHAHARARTHTNAPPCPPLCALTPFPPSPASPRPRPADHALLQGVHHRRRVVAHPRGPFFRVPQRRRAGRVGPLLPAVLALLLAQDLLPCAVHGVGAGLRANGRRAAAHRGRRGRLRDAAGDVRQPGGARVARKERHRRHV